MCFFLSCGGGRFTLTHKSCKGNKKEKTKNNRRVFSGKSFQAQKGEGRKQQKKKNMNSQLMGMDELDFVFLK